MEAFTVLKQTAASVDEAGESCLQPAETWLPPAGGVTSKGSHQLQVLLAVPLAVLGAYGMLPTGPNPLRYIPRMFDSCGGGSGG